MFYVSWRAQRLYGLRLCLKTSFALLCFATEGGGAQWKLPPSSCLAPQTFAISTHEACMAKVCSLNHFIYVVVLAHVWVYAHHRVHAV